MRATLTETTIAIASPTPVPPSGSPSASRTPASSIRNLKLVQSRHRLAILVTLALTLVVQWSATLYWVVAEGNATRLRAEDVLRQMTIAMREQSERLLHDVDSSVKTAKFWMDTHPGDDPRTDPEFGRLITLLRDSSGGLIDIHVVSTDGLSYSLPAQRGVAPQNVADRDFFKAYKQSPASNMMIGAPGRTPGTLQLAVPVASRLDRPLHGISMVYASIEIRHLSGMYEDIRFKPNGTVALLRDDGVVLVRAPFVEQYVGRSIADGYDYLRHIKNGQSGMYMSGNSALDGLERLVSFIRLTDYPLTVIVSAGGEDTFRAWRETRRLSIITGLVISALLLAGALGGFYVLGVVQQSEITLRRLALFDALTGWLNRHAFDDAAQREFTVAGRQSRPLTVMSLDIDHFKRVNDTYGHAAGDIVLRKLSRQWGKSLRSSDITGRLGGEEFAVIMPDTGAEQAADIARRLLEETRALVIEVDGAMIQVTLSIGLATLSPFDFSFDDLLRRSDDALYSAKREGRDQVVVAPSQS
ncbi:sensor domain-containing diguanylate cyclase [Pigmentiphaga litoralis]|uniref:diguanylate cyclase n=1 Tax=Pigmentiphaga litoralis TaxID=516702 RepID=A0A7Y9IVR5_9BURK|nr:GGDEF domain-containing protein [Pigmentiphaga litoralis]NYE22517.1 diguanylate cyclase (GGDEF)-like protein [Pigmentiphaga litoralis]NYE83868.1 diguanylate cyclase (GGDEF)-like protein [Pigmentiphaga litoralis]